MLIKWCLLNSDVYYLKQKKLKAEDLTSFEIKKRRNLWIRIIQNSSEITSVLKLVGGNELNYMEKHHIKKWKAILQSIQAFLINCKLHSYYEVLSHHQWTSNPLCGWLFSHILNMADLPSGYLWKQHIACHFIVAEWKKKSYLKDK